MGQRQNVSYHTLLCTVCSLSVANCTITFSLKLWILKPYIINIFIYVFIIATRYHRLNVVLFICPVLMRLVVSLKPN